MGEGEEAAAETNGSTLGRWLGEKRFQFQLEAENRDEERGGYEYLEFNPQGWCADELISASPPSAPASFVFRVLNIEKFRGVNSMRNFKNTNKKTKKISYDILISLNNKNVLIDIAKLYS